MKVYAQPKGGTKQAPTFLIRRVETEDVRNYISGLRSKGVREKDINRQPSFLGNTVVMIRKRNRYPDDI